MVPIAWRIGLRTVVEDDDDDDEDGVADDEDDPCALVPVFGVDGGVCVIDEPVCVIDWRTPQRVASVFIQCVIDMKMGCLSCSNVSMM